MHCCITYAVLVKNGMGEQRVVAGNTHGNSTYLTQRVYMHFVLVQWCKLLLEDDALLHCFSFTKGTCKTMQRWIKDTAAPQQVDLLLFDAFSGHCLANTVEPMRAANTLAGRRIYGWRFLTLDGDTATSSAGMEVKAHARLADCSGDMLIAMPSYDYRRLASEATGRALRAASQRYGVMAGFDAGAWLLAAAGLLDGYHATIHWEELPGFAEAFPTVDAQRLRHVRDGERITCSGALAAFELMLDLIAERHGQALRLELAALFMSPEATGGQVIPLARSRTHGTYR